jgi:hypothetical protein
MNAVSELGMSSLNSLGQEEEDAVQSGGILEFVPKDRNFQRERQTAQLEAENAALRRELLDAQRSLMQKEILLKNTRIRELELRAALVRLMC